MGRVILWSYLRVVRAHCIVNVRSFGQHQVGVILDARIATTTKHFEIKCGVVV
jgi:hypothetical protein|tara:strand:- start:271 stop:429 length:159 start_codon:yes stop_codon:yes gene_type:complete